MTDQEAYNELAYYTLAHKDPMFIHQYVVDAYAAQHANDHSKPIYLAFALAGLYLHNEKHYSGREVQLAHMQLGKKKGTLPHFTFPPSRGEMTIFDVLKEEPGAKRDVAIEQWSRSVWEAYRSSHAQVAAWLNRELQIMAKAA